MADWRERYPACFVAMVTPPPPQVDYWHRRFNIQAEGHNANWRLNDWRWGEHMIHRMHDRQISIQKAVDTVLLGTEGARYSGLNRWRYHYNDITVVVLAVQRGTPASRPIYELVSCWQRGGTQLDESCRMSFESLVQEFTQPLHGSFWL